VFCYGGVGGGKKVTRVEVTLDGGETWLVCDLDHPEKPNKYGKYWCWCFWSVELEVLDLLGAKEIAVRAWDQSLNTQPEKLIWNLMVRKFSSLICEDTLFLFLVDCSDDDA
jgi:nitrate reductase (NAD(P)H)